MKRFLPLFVAAVLAAGSSAYAGDGQSIALIVTKSGKTYEHCRVFKQYPDGVLFAHQVAMHIASPQQAARGRHVLRSPPQQRDVEVELEDRSHPESIPVAPEFLHSSPVPSSTPIIATPDALADVASADGLAPEVEPSPVELMLCNPAYQRSFDHAQGLATRWDAPAMMTEFGASASPLNVTEPARLADRYLMSWLHWHHPFGPSLEPPDVVASQLVRTYAQATAGQPLAQSFDPASGRFSFRFRPDPTIEAPTSIVGPGPQYPDGYVATVVGGEVTSAPNAGHLTVVADPGSTEVSVAVTRA